MQNVSGTRDLFSDELKKVRLIEQRARDFFTKLGFEEISTPVIEYADVFVKSLGETTDIVMHQMYSFLDKDGKEVVLRPEGTAPVVRFYINLQVERPKVKFFYVGPMFRRERPQKGRYRQFTQVGVEMFDYPSPQADSYLVFILSEFLKNLNIEHMIQVNSVGCPKCRPSYSEALRSYFSGKLLCGDCQRRIDRNPMRILDCKVDSEIVKNAPEITDFLCEGCKNHFLEFLSFSKNMLDEGILSVNPRLVRGLDYYTGVVFEVFHRSGGNAIAAGGRYDLLVQFMGGKPTPACGFAVGVERLSEFVNLEKAKRTGVFITSMKETFGESFKLLKNILKMRSDGTIFEFKNKNEILGELMKRVDINLDLTKSLKSQLRFADSENFRFALIVGKRELLGGKVVVRDLELSKQEEVKITELFE